MLHHPSTTSVYAVSMLRGHRDDYRRTSNDKDVERKEHNHVSANSRLPGWIRACGACYSDGSTPRPCLWRVHRLRACGPPSSRGGKYTPHYSQVWERNAFEAERARAASYLAGIMLTHASDLVGIDTEIGVASGIVPPTICSVARSEHADLLVMCSRRETDPSCWFFGSVAQEVVRHSSVPVLVLHEQGVALPASRAGHPVRAVVALDGSPLSKSILEPAAQLIGKGQRKCHRPLTDDQKRCHFERQDEG